MPKGFVFDLDDTLIDNVHDYSEPILDATKLIIDAVGHRAPHVVQIINMYQEIDLSRRQQIDPETGAHYGYSRRRFPGSLVETYRIICKKVNWPVIEEIESQLWDIGLRAFDEERYQRNIKRGAVDLLKFLLDSGDGVAILTKGDLEVQKTKLAALFKVCQQRGIDTSKIQMRIVDTEKSTNDFSEIRETMPYCRNWYSIGNDYHKDIAPSLEAGFYGLWIPVETWESLGKTQEIKNLMNKVRCSDLASFDELLDLYDCLE